MKNNIDKIYKYFITIMNSFLCFLILIFYSLQADHKIMHCLPIINRNSEHWDQGSNYY